MSEKVTGKVFDLKLFKRLIMYVKSYRSQFILSTMSVLFLAGLAAVYPMLLKIVVDDYIINKNAEQLLIFSLIMLGIKILQVVFQFLYIYFTNWLGQHIIKDIRTELFGRMLRFKMQYFNTSPVGKLVTRVVSDTETIASIFGQGLFVIISDLLQMLVIIIVMVWMDWGLALIVIAVLPIIIYLPKFFRSR
jgi:subfamily B ATP-binding cassette protein MsbA